MGKYSINIDNVPTVNPTGAPDNDRQRLDVSADQFGGSIARSLGSLGESVQKASSEGFNVINLQDTMDARTHAAELHSWMSDKITDAQEKFLGLRGKAALDGLPDFKKQIDDIRNDARGQAGNPYTQQLVDTEGRRMIDVAYSGGARHAATQRTTWEANTAQNSATSYGDSAVLSAVQSQAPRISDDLVVTDRLFKSDQETRNFLSSQGYEGDALEQQVKRNRGKNVENIVKQLSSDGSKTGLSRAIDFLHSQYDKIDPASRVTIESGLRTRAAKYDGQTTADRIMGRGQNVPPGYVERTFQIESGGNPNAQTGSYKGLGQFSPTLEARYGINDQNRGDRDVQARALALENQDNHDALARVLGHEPTPADYYFAHQQGIGGAVAHLSNPNLPAWQNMAGTAEGREKGAAWAKQAIWGNMTPQMKAQFPGGVESVTSADFARMWAQRFNGQEIKAAGIGPDATPSSKYVGAQNFVAQSKTDVLTQIQNDPYLIDHPEAMQAALSHANQIFEVQNASYLDQERRIKVQNEQRKQVSDDTENAYIKDLYGDKPTANVQQIVNDDRLSREAKDRLVKVAGEPTLKDAKTYGPGFEKAFAAIHAPAGAPERITDPQELYGRLGAKTPDALTMAGVEKLRGEILLRRTPEGVAESEMKKQFLANAKSQITGSDEGFHIKDPKGDELYLKFLAQVWPSYDEGRKQGKSATQLLNPDSPDYIGKTISTFKRPTNQWYADMMADNAPDNTQTPKFDIKSIKTVSEAVKAYRDGKMTKAEADQLALDRGWGFRKAAAPAAPAAAVPQVPISQ